MQKKYKPGCVRRWEEGRNKTVGTWAGAVVTQGGNEGRLPWKRGAQLEDAVAAQRCVSESLFRFSTLTSLWFL